MFQNVRHKPAREIPKFKKSSKNSKVKFQKLQKKLQIIHLNPQTPASIFLKTHKSFLGLAAGARSYKLKQKKIIRDANCILITICEFE